MTIDLQDCAAPVRHDATSTWPADHVSVLEAFRAEVRHRPAQRLLTSLDDSGEDAQTLTYAELDAAAEAIAAHLHHSHGMAAGTRALLVYPPSLDFACAFLGCLYAGIVPVPVCPPNPSGRDLAGFRAIAQDCGADAVLSNGVYMHWRTLGLLTAAFKRSRQTWPALSWLRTDRLPRAPAPTLAPAVPQPGDTAFLQYTSGSVSAPKGVVITYGNLAHQAAVNWQTLDFDGNVRAVFWVPHFHDLGLISGIVNCLYGAGHLYLMSPTDFMRKPSLWMEAMSRVKATHTAAPNFGYDLVVRKTTAHERARWDLSPLRVALSGGEPVRAATLQAFAEAFATSGLRASALQPVYGLAEHSVDVTAGGGTILQVDRAALERGQVVPAAGSRAAGDARLATLVGSGRAVPGVRLRIVDPVSRRPSPEHQVGEIWVDSPSKARGYLGREEESTSVFSAQVEGDIDPRRYLRTGDLGFTRDGELFITGRLKDTIIIRGRNHQPEDIEICVRGAHTAIRPGGVAVFGVPYGDIGGEAIGVAVELTATRLSPDEANDITRAIRRRVQEGHHQTCRLVVLGRTGLVAKTTSGKVRRAACKARVLSGDLGRDPDVLHVARFDPEGEGTSVAQADATVGAVAAPRMSAAELSDFLVRAVAQRTGAPPEQIEIDAPLGIYALDSLALAQIYGELSERLGWALDPGQVAHLQTIRAMAEHISQAAPSPAAR